MMNVQIVYKCVNVGMMIPVTEKSGKMCVKTFTNIGCCVAFFYRDASGPKLQLELRLGVI